MKYPASMNTDLNAVLHRITNSTLALRSHRWVYAERRICCERCSASRQQAFEGHFCSILVALPTSGLTIPPLMTPVAITLNYAGNTELGVDRFITSHPAAE